MDSEATLAGSPSQPPSTAATNTDPEFWMKRLNEMKKVADIPTAEPQRPAYVGTTYLLKDTQDDSNRQESSPLSFKEQVRRNINCSDGYGVED